MRGSGESPKKGELSFNITERKNNNNDAGKKNHL